MSSSLLDRDPTPEDLEAERDQPRPGVWAGEPGADLRALTQDETDLLIRAELVLTSPRDGREQLIRACGGIDSIPVPVRRSCQRGGIDSDPLVRVLARRAWGDRDRQWFELRGVRKGEAVGEPRPPSSGVAIVGSPWPGDMVLGDAQHDARPGETVEVWDRTFSVTRHCRVNDRLREPPDALVTLAIDPAGGMDFTTLGLRVGERAPMLMPYADDDVAIDSNGDPLPAGVSAGRARIVAITANTITLARRERPAPPIIKPAPPVPRWTRKRRARSQPPRR